VAATQNPVEYEGTYPLPEAQLDRFLLKLVLPLPSRTEEIAILARHTDGFDPRDLAAAGVSPVAGPHHLAVARDAAAERSGCARRSRATSWTCAGPPAVRPRCVWGLPARGHCAAGRLARLGLVVRSGLCAADDVKALARPALRPPHRVRAEAELEGATADGVLDSVLASVPVPR